ncbi:MAG: thioesterase [Sphingobacteriales bacterium SCN 48-20]|uniref:acyl-CoA thioesterase n=1 Tax=Terrimonas ferruginea TaxID=249 RepID=UPI000868ABBE|nr:thioesterase family protein [Terrimonas ferruginea]MBN8782684.1 thioesterase family protein [Terrimonas ferruginea]ODT92864.1 MAG: thioesterase [Sphingobacteriales bacterium SCN 48-20]OJW43893.1 MAG: thioesterase [Sphingobacteriales bacterium 48-107]
MARIKIQAPENFSFTTSIPVRITDINYGGHVGNDRLLSLLHEARIHFLASAGYSEVNFAGAGMIMADVGIEFRNELFYGDTVLASVTAAEFSRVSFDIYYKLEKETEGKRVLVALAKTGMVCYDYQQKKITAIPEEARQKLSGQ